VSQKICPVFLLLEYLCQNLAHFNDFWHVKSPENLASKAYKFAHLASAVATLPREIQKSLSTILLICTSDYLHYLIKTMHQHITLVTQSSFCAWIR